MSVSKVATIMVLMRCLSSILLDLYFVIPVLYSPSLGGEYGLDTDRVLTREVASNEVGPEGNVDYPMSWYPEEVEYLVYSITVGMLYDPAQAAKASGFNEHILSQDMMTC